MRVEILAAAACLALIAIPAAARQPQPGNVADRAASFTPPPPPPGTNSPTRRQLGVVVNENNRGVVVAAPAGVFTDTDELTRIRCPERDGCTIIFRLWAVVDADQAGRWAFCSRVDGSQANTTCFFVGAMTAGQTYTEQTSFGTYQVAKGVHQVKTQVYTEGGGSIVTWHHEYEITTP